MANVYAVRIHPGDASAGYRQLMEMLKGVEGSFVFAEEVEAKRLHFQGWVRSDIKDQALRKRLKAAFPECVGNKGYSLSAVKDFEAYSRYCLKGTPETMAKIVASYGIAVTDAHLQDEHRAYWSTRDKPTKSNKSIVDDVSEWFYSQDFDVSPHEIREIIAERLCETFAARKKGINTFLIRAYTNSIEWRVNPASHRNILNAVLERY